MICKFIIVSVSDDRSSHARWGISGGNQEISDKEIGGLRQCIFSTSDKGSDVDSVVDKTKISVTDSDMRKPQTSYTISVSDTD